MHDSRLIANKFIEIATGMGKTVTSMQLLKLVYIAHGWMLGLYGLPLTDDRIQAWKFGPVIPDLYHAIKQYRDGPVSKLLPTRAGDETVNVENDLIKQIFDIYGDRSGLALSDLTHQAGTPWDKVYVPSINSIPISNDIIEEHYKSLYAKAQG